MKRILLAMIVLALFRSNASAQATRFGFSGGVTFSNMMDKTNDGKTHGDFAAGITLGILMDLPMEKNGSFQAGLNIVQKGTKNLDLGDKGKFKYNITYLEAPLNVVFKFGNSNGKFMAGGGAVTAIALSGKRTTDVNNASTKKTINFGDTGQDDIKWIDFGADGIIGYESSGGFFVALNYTYGITTLIINPAGENLFNRSFGLKVGYLLGAKKK